MLTTRSSTPKLSEAARHVVIPSGIVTTSWPRVKAECQRLGINFDPWQDGAGQIIFGRRADGSYACSIGGVVMSIPRQVGKTFFLGAIAFALCLLEPGKLVIWTAHMLPTAGETHRAMAAMAKRPKIAPFIKQVRMGSGDESVEFTNGSRILFGARERGFGLGFTKVGLLILDEGQRLTEKTLDDLVPTMNQADDPLMFIVGTPPRPSDRGEEFKRRRRDALSGESDDMVYIECSADPDVRVTKWPLGKVDWDAVERGNPSFPTRTPRSAVLRMRKQLTPESFQREALGVWDDDQAGSRRISAEAWAATEVEEPPKGRQGYAVAYSFDGSRVALAGVRLGEKPHVQLIDVGDATGTDALAGWLAERWRESVGIVIAGKAGSDTLRQALFDRGVGRRKVHVVSTGDYAAACSMFDDAVTEKAVTHWLSDGQWRLDESVAVCDRKFRRGDSGAWGWEATTAGGDETPLEAVSLAYWLARTGKRSGAGGAVFA